MLEKIYEISQCWREEKRKRKRWVQLEKSEGSATLESSEKFSMDYAENMSLKVILFFVCLFVLINKWNNLCGENNSEKN